jgi:hypothetical protein
MPLLQWAILSLAANLMVVEHTSMSSNLFPSPPLSQTNDEVHISSKDFEEQCRAHFKAIAERQHWIISNSRATKSENWGLVWRADFLIAGYSPKTPLVNRLVCWKDKESGELSSNIAIGQEVQPLGLR